MKAERIEEPTEPGWYRARWNGETKSTCVEVVRRGSSLWVKMDELHSFADIAEWDLSINAVFAERDRLATEVAELRRRIDALEARAKAAPLGEVFVGGGLHHAAVFDVADACVRYMRGEPSRFDRLFPRPAHGGPTT